MISGRRFLAAEAGAITLDWLTLVAGVLVIGIAAVFAVGGDVTRLAEGIGYETEAQVASSNPLAAERRRERITAGATEPVRRDFADRLEKDAAAMQAASITVDVHRPMALGATGAFEPAIAEPERTEAALEPVIRFGAEPPVAALDAGIAVETGAPRADCAAALPEGVTAREETWVGGILREEVRCRAATHGSKAEPRRTAPAPEPVLALPAAAATESAGLALAPAPSRADCAAAAEGSSSNPWVGGIVALEKACAAMAREEGPAAMAREESPAAR